MLGHLAVFGLMCLVAILHTLPLVMDLSAVVPGRDLGDNVSFVWNLWWFSEAVRLGVPFFHTPLLMAPLGADLALHTHSATQAGIGAMLLGAWSSVAAQNILLIASLAVNGMSVYLLALEAGARRAGAGAGGVLFIVAPQVALRLMGHFNLVAVWPLTLACWWFVRTMRAPTMPRGAMLGLLATLLVLADYYYTVFFGLFAAAYIVTDVWEIAMSATRRWGAGAVTVTFAAIAGLALAAAAAIAVTGGGVFSIAGVAVRATSPTNMLTAGWIASLVSVWSVWRPGLVIRRRDTVPGGIAGALCIALMFSAAMLFPLLRAIFNTIRAGDYVTQGAGLRSGPQGIDILTLVLGPPFHGLAGGAVRGVYEQVGINVMEASGWIGATVLVLVLASMRHWREREHRRWLVLALGFLIWALGPYLIAAGSNTGILLPQAAARYVPLLNNARMPGRAMVVVSVLACVIAARYLSTRTRRTAAVITTIGVIEALAAPLPMVAIPVSPAQAVLAASRETGGVLPIPFGVRDGFGAHGLVDHSALYFQTHHGRPIAGGFVARLPPRVLGWYEKREPYRTLIALGDNHAAQTAVPSCERMRDGLDEASLSFVVVNRQLATPAMLDLVARMPVTPIAHDAQYDVLRVVSCAERSP